MKPFSVLLLRLLHTAAPFVGRPESVYISPAGKTSANMLDVWAVKSLHKPSEPRALVRWLTCAACDERACVAGAVNAEVLCVLSVTIWAMSKSNGMVSEVICCVRDGVPVVASSYAPILSVVSLSDWARCYS